MKYGIDTRCQHLADDNKDEIYGAISYPIYQSATFARDRVGGGSGYDYSRLQNPTREHLEKIVASLEEGIDALAFSTGMAAITALMEIFKPGDHIIIDEDLYGGSVRLFHSINVKNGLTFTSVDLSSVDVEDYIQDNTKAIYAETPTNPMMRVSDLEELSKKAKKHELLLIVDNTFLSPYFQNPLKLGADIVVHSGTKYLGGHNDTLAGFLITNREDIQEQLRFIIKTTGATLAPMDSWLILRGIKTLGVRMERAQENALKIAHFLEKQEYVTRVLYPGLESHPGYELMKKQARGFGSILTFEVDSKERAYHILENVKLIQIPAAKSQDFLASTMHYGMNAASEHKDEAWKFLEYLAGEEANDIIGKSGIDLPARLSSQEYYGASFTKFDGQAFVDVIPSAKPAEMGPAYALDEIGSIMNEQIIEIFNKNVEVKEGLEQMAADINAAIEAGK